MLEKTTPSSSRPGTGGAFDVFVSSPSTVVAAFTADGGYTWTPVEMAMRYTGPLILNAGIIETVIDGKRRFLLPAHRNTLQKDPLGSRDHFILSSTSLLEWKLEAFIPQPVDHKVFLHEGNIAPGDAPGELKIVMRTADMKTERALNPGLAYSSSSQDGGKTWSDPIVVSNRTEFEPGAPFKDG